MTQILGTRLPLTTIGGAARRIGRFRSRSSDGKMPFNVNKCYILQLVTWNENFDYEMNGTKIEIEQCVRNLDITVASSLKFSQQCKTIALKANRMLCFKNRNFSIENEDVNLPQYISLVRTDLEYAVQFWSTYQLKDIRRKTRRCPAKDYKDYTSLRNKSYTCRYWHD